MSDVSVGLSGVPSFEERVCELGREALAEQERQVGEIRSRGSALLAGGAVIAGLLAGPVFTDDHPAGNLELAVAILGLAGAGVLLVAVVVLFSPYEMGFSVIHEGAGRVKVRSRASGGCASRVARRPGRGRRRSSHPFGRAGRAECLAVLEGSIKMAAVSRPVGG